MKKNKRIFIPGDQWLYFKIYATEENVEIILKKIIPAIITKLSKQDLFSKWFFIRYADPDSHIRLRILAKDDCYMGQIIHIVNIHINKYLKNKLIQKVQLDTYVRELERYGEYTTELAESFFYIDSKYMLTILKKLESINDENFRWLSSLLMIDAMFDAFSFNLNKKKDIISQMSNSFKIEFGFNNYNSKQFNIKYRENKKTIEEMFSKSSNNVFFSNLKIMLRNKNNELLSVINNLYHYETKKIINTENLISSYIHMMLNRLFAYSPRIYELIIYDFLRRKYESDIARQQNNINFLQ